MLKFKLTSVTSNIQENNNHRLEKKKVNSAKVPRKFQVKNLPDAFLNDETTATKLSETLDKLQHSMDAKEEADKAYKHLAKWKIS